MSRVAQLSVRAAAAADAAAIAHVHRESWRTSYSGILPRDVVEHETGRRTEEVWRRRIGISGQRTWVAETAPGRIVGFANCGPARGAVDGLEAEIYALYVIQPEQGRGIGRELVRACAADFVRQGLFGFFLWVLKANRARLFYEAIGGREVAAKRERLGLHDYEEVAYAWHDLSVLLSDDDLRQRPARGLS